MQVKFRGKRKGGDEWLIGDLNHIQGGVFIFPRENAPLNSPDWFEVEPSSIGMFTGLTDKNGKEIYGAVGEKGGDILKCSDGRVVNVVYSEWRFMTESKPYSKMEKRMCESNSIILQGCDRYANLKNTEIIGNAFDNHELLEK